MWRRPAAWTSASWSSRLAAGSWQVYIRVGEDGWAAASGKKHLTRGGAETEAATLGYTVVEAP
jgi:hypothetical protein